MSVDLEKLPHARDVIRLVLAIRTATEREYERAEEAAAAKAEAEGNRIVNGGQSSGWTDDVCDWEYRDWRTREVLASGTSTEDEQDRLVDAAIAADEKPWLHIDNLEFEYEEQVSKQFADLGYTIEVIEWLSSLEPPYWAEPK